MYDGNTTNGDFDWKSVYYYFNGISFQTWANYFPGDQLITFTQLNPANSPYRQLLGLIGDSFIQSGGKLSVTLFDSTVSSTPNYIELPGSYNATLSFYAEVTPVPEPETYAMMLAGLGLLGVMARRRKQAQA
jgi:hypothetical protein